MSTIQTLKETYYTLCQAQDQIMRGWDTQLDKELFIDATKFQTGTRSLEKAYRALGRVKQEVLDALEKETELGVQVPPNWSKSPVMPKRLS